jgi:hypothetical protein
MSRTLSALVLASATLPAHAADGGATVAGFIVLVIVGLAVWLSAPTKRRPKAARPVRSEPPQA